MPQGDVYRVLHAGKFGERIALPEPFDLKLDTSAFPVHRASAGPGVG
ncbi:hypothetical protein QFZ75_002960 [Streptomyces sp. V3I8]|nr:hypothetical protein [Streptomyces sp. V3I8]MDQ1036544.1 hypothetical protein [Streptomyces sp. V3I8]